MRLGTFNVENLFERPKAMDLSTWSEGKAILKDFAELNGLIQEPVYTDSIKKKLLQILQRHPGLIKNGRSKYIVLRDIRGHFLNQPKNAPAQIAASGRLDWIGWFELITEPVKETATENTGRVIDLIKADVLCVIEADNRTGLKHFNDGVLPKVTAKPYAHVMLIDGNDDRGIDVGLLTHDGFPIVSMLSHVDDVDAKGEIFSRDCAEYEIATPSGASLLLLVNHFKSKGYGGPAESAAKRLRQATRVREIYEQRIKDGFDFIAVLGDLNETPGEPPMDPLLRKGSKLEDIMAHPRFKGDGREGTHGNGTPTAKLDYILMSPKLSEKVKAGGIERRGVWGGKNGTLFPHLDTMKSEKDAASDHAALWVDLEI